MKIQQQVQAEYGEPFWDVVKYYADSGESITATSLILGYAHPMGLYNLAKRKGVLGWFKPATQTNGFISAGSRKEQTEARVQQRQEIYRKRYFEFNGRMDSMAGHARHQGLNPRTVATRLFKGWSIEKALTTPVQKQRYYPRKTVNQDHPWRST